MSAKKLTPEQRFAALEEKVETLASLENQVKDLTESQMALESENSELKDKLEAAEKSLAGSEAPAKYGKTETEMEDDAKKGENTPTAPKPTEPAPVTQGKETGEDNKDDSKASDDSADKIAAAIDPLKQEIEALKSKLAEAESAKAESANTKQPGNDDTIVEAEDGGDISGDRETPDENAYAAAFAKDPEVARLNPEGITYEEACERADTYGLNLLSTMEAIYGSEAKFNENQK